MLSEVINEILQEARSVKQKIASAPTTQSGAEAPATNTSGVTKKASAALKEEALQKLREAGLTKFAVYIEEADDPNVLLNLVIEMADEFKKRASVSTTAFRPADIPNRQDVDPITAFALGL
jgi:hypothetical protein